MADGGVRDVIIQNTLDALVPVLILRSTGLPQPCSCLRWADQDWIQLPDKVSLNSVVLFFVW